MILRFTVIIIVMISGFASMAVESSSQDLTGYYDLALDKSERIGIAAAQWKAAEARFSQASDSWVPDIALSGSQLYRNSIDSSDNDNSSDRDSQSDLRVRASQPIYQGFRLTRLAEARESDMRAAEFDELRVRELLYLDVADAYYLLLSLQRERAILGDLENALSDTVQTFEERIKLGQSRRADLLRAQTDLAQAAADINLVEGQLDAARQLMSFLTGVEAASIRAREETELPVIGDLSMFQTSIVSRLDIKAGEARVEAALRDVEAARGERQPSVDAQASYILLEDPDEDREWEVGLALNFPFFDDGVRRAKIREQSAVAEINELSLAQLRREADLEVNNRIILWEAAVRQVTLLRDAASLAGENYKVQQEDYLLGRSSQLDALSALAQWQELRRREATADAAARIAYAALKVAAGVPVP